MCGISSAKLFANSMVNTASGYTDVYIPDVYQGPTPDARFNSVSSLVSNKYDLEVVFFIYIFFAWDYPFNVLREGPTVKQES